MATNDKSALARGVVTGTVAGLGIFIATNWLVIGYRVTFVGSLIGFVYAFVLGFVVAYNVTEMYNGLADARDRHGQKR